MSDEDLMKLMLKVDPRTARIPPGVRAIANAVEAAERERCARIVETANVAGAGMFRPALAARIRGA